MIDFIGAPAQNRTEDDGLQSHRFTIKLRKHIQLKSIFSYLSIIKAYQTRIKETIH